jgi:hypothetical protein
MFTTKEEVIEAYIKTELKPICGKFYSSDFTCVCPLSVLFAYKTSVEEMKEWILEKQFSPDFFNDLIGLLDIKTNDNDLALVAFYEGFDNITGCPSVKVGDEFYPYYEFGQEIREAVIERFGYLK